MKKKTIAFLLVMICCFTGCKTESAKSNDPQMSNEYSTENTGNQVTNIEEQHIYLPENFFNRWGGNQGEAEFGENCLPNLCLDSYYDNPQDVDLYRLFRYGFGLEITEEDREYLKSQGETYSLDLAKITGEKMNEVLRQYFDISLEETNKIKLDFFTYKEDTDTYYTVATNVASVNVEKQYLDEDGNIVIEYAKGKEEDAEKGIAVLKLKGNRYVFLSNKKMN